MGCCDIKEAKEGFSEEELKKFYGDVKLDDYCKKESIVEDKKPSLLGWTITILIIGVIAVGLII